jgi:RNA polymerase sigma-70 factor (ECF subfamily)
MHDRSSRERRFLELLRPVHSAAERYALSLANDRDDARDLLQDAIIIVWQRFDEIRDTSAFKSYLFTVLTHCCRNAYRKRKRIVRMFDSEDVEIASSAPLPDRTTEASLVREAMEALPQRSKEALVLFEMNDLSVEEIGRIQNSSISAVKVRLMRARKLLAARLGIAEDEAVIPQPR